MHRHPGLACRHTLTCDLVADQLTAWLEAQLKDPASPLCGGEQVHDLWHKVCVVAVCVVCACVALCAVCMRALTRLLQQLKKIVVRVLKDGSKVVTGQDDIYVAAMLLSTARALKAAVLDLTAKYSSTFEAAAAGDADAIADELWAEWEGLHHTFCDVYGCVGIHAFVEQFCAPGKDQFFRDASHLRKYCSPFASHFVESYNAFLWFRLNKAIHYQTSTGVNGRVTLVCAEWNSRRLEAAASDASTGAYWQAALGEASDADGALLDYRSFLGIAFERCGISQTPVHDIRPHLANFNHRHGQAFVGGLLAAFENASDE